MSFFVRFTANCNGKASYGMEQHFCYSAIANYPGICLGFEHSFVLLTRFSSVVNLRLPGSYPAQSLLAANLLFVIAPLVVRFELL